MAIYSGSSIMGTSDYGLYNLRLKSQINQSLISKMPLGMGRPVSGLSSAFLYSVYDAKAASSKVMKNYYNKLKQFEEDIPQEKVKETSKKESFVTFIDELLTKKRAEEEAHRNELLGKEIDKSA